MRKGQDHLGTASSSSLQPGDTCGTGTSFPVPGLQPCAQQHLSRKPTAHTLGAITSKLCHGEDETAHLVLQGRAPAPLSPQLWGNLPHTAPGDRSCTLCQPSYSPGAQPAQRRKHLTVHPTTRSDFLTSHKENQSWYLQPLLLQVSGSAQISNTVEKNQQDEGVFALV